jgi:thiamine-phosphate pyrophosphorylase
MNRSAGPFPQVVAITDATLSDDELVRRARLVLDAVPRGSVGIQLRDRTKTGRALFDLAARLQSLCTDAHAPLFVNDRLDVALAIGAGAHLGTSSVSVVDARALLGDAIVSVAAHSLADVDDAAANGASFALVSPIFSTPGKGPPRGVGFIAEARARAPRLRLYALGGVESDNAASCADAGADGVAVIRAVWQARDPALAAKTLVEAVRAGEERTIRCRP